MRKHLRAAISVGLFLCVWEASLLLQLVPTYTLSSPTTIVVTIVRLLGTGELQTHVLASMQRIVVGYSIALFAGALLGGLMGWFRTLDDYIDPIVEMFRPVSPLAILPLAILWLGIGQASKIFIIAYACIFPVMLNTYAGVRSVPKSALEAARIFGATTDEILRKVVLFHSLPLIMTGARISFAVALIVIIAAEMVAADTGLGYMILTAQQTFRTTELFAGIVTIASIGFLGDRILRWLRVRLCPWYVETETQ